MTRAITLTLAGRTDVGRVRPHNEDAFAMVDLGSGQPIVDGVLEGYSSRALLSLSDGMGGHQSGEVASALVVETLATELAAVTDSLDDAITRAVKATNTAVHTTAQEPEHHGMGATLTAVVIDGDTAWIAEVGDSRAYLLREGRMRQITRDQSLVQMLVDHGMMTPEEARDAPQKNVIIQAMGLASTVEPAIGKLALRRGDRILLCCDGLSNAMTDEELGTIVGEHAPALACEKLIELANERGGNDNLTAIVALVDGSEIAAPDPNVRITSTFEVVRDFVKNAPASGPPPALPVATAPAERSPVPVPYRASPRSPWLFVVLAIALAGALVIASMR